jgi:hypothetical protein
VLFAYIAQYLSEQVFCPTFRMPRNAFNQLVVLLRRDFLRDVIQGARASSGVVELAARRAIILRILASASYLDLVMIFRIAKQFMIFFTTVGVISRRLGMPGVPTADERKLRNLADGFSLSRHEKVRSMGAQDL